MASLVKATYVLEKDRQEGRVGPRALAPAWWQHFNFECTRTLEDDRKIFGCIYELKPAFRLYPSAPRFIIAFRGTMLDRSNFFRDVFLDFSVVFGGIKKTTRFLTALDCIYQLIHSNCGGNTQNIWVGGHCLGASIATVVGKFMAKQDIHLNTFLFNPPYASIPLDLIPLLDNKLKERLRTYQATLSAAVAIGMADYRTRKCNELSKLASWTPYLFVNPGDPICAGYKSYFERHQKTKAGIMGHIRRLEAHMAIREMWGEKLGFESELSHNLPSAKLAVNLKMLRGFGEAHGLLQWWQRDISLGVSDHHYQPVTS